MNSIWPDRKEQPLFALLAGVFLLSASLLLFGRARNTLLEYRVIGIAPVNPGTVTVSGVAKVSGAPDVAEVSAGLYSEGSDVASVQKENTRKMNAIIDSLKSSGIAERDLQTSNYSISPRFDYRDGRQNLSGYSVSQQVRIRIRNLDQIGSVLTRVAQLGANQVGGVTFTIDDPDRLTAEAREKAIKDAREKADVLAKSLGVEIVRVVNFSESGGSQPMPLLYRSEAAPIAAQDVQIEAGTLDVTSNVSLTFEIH